MAWDTTRRILWVCHGWSVTTQRSWSLECVSTSASLSSGAANINLSGGGQSADRAGCSMRGPVRCVAGALHPHLTQPSSRDVKQLVSACLRTPPLPGTAAPVLSVSVCRLSRPVQPYIYVSHQPLSPRHKRSFSLFSLPCLGALPASDPHTNPTAIAIGAISLPAFSLHTLASLRKQGVCLPDTAVMTTHEHAC